MSTFPQTIAFDFTVMRPGCALVQRAMGTSITNENLQRFDDWLLSPTPDMQVVTLHTADELVRAAALSNGKGVVA